MVRRSGPTGNLLRVLTQLLRAQGILRLSLMILLPLTVLKYVQATSAISTDAAIRFAVIGDFGVDNSKEAAVAQLVKSWNPAFIVTVGDNNYLSGSYIDRAIGKYYQEYISPYLGTFGNGSSSGNRFYPSLGNHDWESMSCANGTCQGAYLDYFTLPGNERYYDFIQGSVHFFIINSDAREPDGISATSGQAAWLKARLAASTAAWKVVILHHPPYSSGSVGSAKTLQWPFKSWGANVVLTGHAHHYERLNVGGQVYFVDGLGGGSISSTVSPIAGSQLIYKQYHGAMLVAADATTITFQFIDINGKLVDTYTMTNDPSATATSTAINTAIATNTPTRTPTNTPVNTPVNTATNTPVPNATNTPTPNATDAIFSDDFESGALSNWSANTNSAASQVTAAAALNGNLGWKLAISDNTATYLTDNSPNAEPRYRARFYFDPNTIPMVSGDEHQIFAARQGSTSMVRVDFRYYNNQYQLRIRTLDDASIWQGSVWYVLSDSSHPIELDWQAATAAGANNGTLTLWLDGIVLANVTAIDNDTRWIDSIRLGPSTNLDTGTRGTYYFDDFVSRRQNYIGPVAMANAAALSEDEWEEIEDAYKVIPNEHPALTRNLQPDRAQSIAGDLEGLAFTAAIPAGTLTTPATVIVHGLDDTAMSDGYLVVGTIFDIKVMATTGLSVDRFAQPVDVTIGYGDVTSPAFSRATPSLWRWNGSAGVWEAYPATVDPLAQTLTLQLDQPATLGIFQRETDQSQSIYLPLIKGD